MKKIDFSHVIAGTRKLGATKETFLHLQENAQELTDALSRALLSNNQTDPILLWGCVNSGSGLNYIISAGAIYYQGEIYQVPAFTGTATGANVPTLSSSTTYRTNDPVVYSDTNTFNTHAIVQMIWTITASGGGLVDFASIKKFSKSAQASWQNISLASGWTTYGGITPQYRIDAFGQVHLRGSIATTTSGSTNFKAVNAGGVPSAPSGHSVMCPKLYFPHGGGAYQSTNLFVSIEDDGSLYVYKPNGTASPDALDVALFLDGISYWPAGT